MYGLSKLSWLLAALPLVYGAPTASPDSLHPAVLEAMKRDLGLDAEQATARVRREVAASDTIETLKTTAGASFAGAWLADNGNVINIAVTDEAAVSAINAAGGTATLVSTPKATLDEKKAALDALLAGGAKRSVAAKEGVAGWYVDVTSNKVVLEAIATGKANAAALAAEVGLAEEDFEVKEVAAMPETYATIQGGRAYNINGSSRCSIGFTVTTGFVTAGHCGRAGATASVSGATVGTFSGSVFPGSADGAYVRTTSGQTLSGQIYRYNSGANIAVTGSTVTAVGGSICRSGSTTGVFCGTVGAFGQTVNYSQGGVTGLTRTSVCAEPGDSGGSFYTGGQAQGVTSGGSGNCQSGGVTYFQPVNEILSTYGLTLVRG